MKSIRKNMFAAAVFILVLAGTAEAKDNLAVLPFTGGTAEEGETIAELFSFSSELNTEFAPIPRTSITRAIGNEQKFQTGTGMTDPDTIAAIGKQLGAKYVVAGNIAKLGNRNLLIISILKIDDLRQIAGDIQTYGKIEEIQDKLPAMAQNIITATRMPDQAGLDKLAVTPVELGGNIDSRVADTLAQILSLNLIKSGKYAVYPRTATLEQVQAEYKTQMSGVTADENVVDIGKGENPRFVLSVVARRLGNRNMFNASIINLESGVQLIGRSEAYNSLDDGIEVMGNLARELTGAAAGTSLATDELDGIRSRARSRAGSSAGPAKKSGGSFGYGVLNLALGLGSFIQGDWGGGGLVILTGYGAAAGLIIWELSLKYEDDMAGIPGAIGIGVGGLTALYGFIRPAVYNRHRALAMVLDNIHVSPVPAAGGRGGVLVSYRFTF
ncbi:MAG: penicillin-binding protein activator LpoB [Treponema sp.]|jgi:TolB-like protein|nr:penicillin-binding protein activator LpoB [Treponema sp.]